MSEIRIKAAEWVADYAADDLNEASIISLTSAPSREYWFKWILPALDYEVVGGTWDAPKWAWTDHPWFAALGLTNEECERALESTLEEEA